MTLARNIQNQLAAAIERAERAEAEVERLRGAGWQPIESAPRDEGTEILVADHRVEGGFIQCVAWTNGPHPGWQLSDGPVYPEGFFTRWMPTPPPPTEPQGGAPLAEQWPSGCRHPNSCSHKRSCAYAGCCWFRNTEAASMIDAASADTGRRGLEEGGPDAQ